MPGNGVFFAIESADEARLLAQPSARARAAFVANEIEERWDLAWLCTMGEMWFPVHYCLHGSSSFPVPGSPAEARTIFGGEPLGIGGMYTIDYKSVALTRQIASALGKMRDEAVWARAGLVQRQGYEGAKGESVEADVVDSIHALKDFFRKAADDGRATIFTVDL